MVSVTYFVVPAAYVQEAVEALRAKHHTRVCDVIYFNPRTDKVERHEFYVGSGIAIFVDTTPAQLAIAIATKISERAEEYYVITPTPFTEIAIKVHAPGEQKLYTSF